MSPTRSLHKPLVQSEGDKWLFQLPQEVFEEATHHVDVLDLVQQEWSFSQQEGLSEGLHQTLSPRNPVQTLLDEQKTLLVIKTSL